MPGQSPAVTSKSNTYCFCITTRRKRLAAFLKGGRIQSRAYKPAAEVRVEGSHLAECEGLPATQDRPRSAHRHLHLHSFTSQQPHRSNPALSSGRTENHHQKRASTAQNKPNQDFFGSTQAGLLPEQIPTCHPERHSDSTTAKPRSPCSQGTPVQMAPRSPKSLSKQFYSNQEAHPLPPLSLISSTTGHAFFFFCFTYFLVVPAVRGILLPLN